MRSAVIISKNAFIGESPLSIIVAPPNNGRKDDNLSILQTDADKLYHGVYYYGKNCNEPTDVYDVVRIVNGREITLFSLYDPDITIVDEIKKEDIIFEIPDE